MGIQAMKGTVKRNHTLPFRKQFCDQGPADKPCSAGNKNRHGTPPILDDRAAGTAWKFALPSLARNAPATYALRTINRPKNKELFRSEPVLATRRIMDLFSDILSSISLRNLNLARFRLRAPWGLNTQGFPPGFSLIVLEGECWIGPREDKRQVFSKGDSFIAPRGEDIEFASEAEGPTENIARVWQQDAYAGFENEPPAAVHDRVWGGDGAACELLGLAFEFSSGTDERLLKSLPRTIALHDDGNYLLPLANSVALYLASANFQNEPGAFAQRSRLAEAVMISQLRRYLLNQPDQTGLIGGIRDARLNKALDAMHRDQGRRWTLESLAREAGMSRSAFAKHFNDIIGEPPMSFLNTWRVKRVCLELTRSDISISEAARRAGFPSETAMRRSFSREMGCSPRDWRREQRQSRNGPAEASQSKSSRT
ncbi:AraC family transcriptional regulator [Maricaulis parjimensis]|uniref:AraC family transcriptional regulator n=1 Tax=Maricaulis parjimensis TaxID=144023 RepID=UPI001EEE74B9|nr:AraC family transcriptional regulator [Maricaulis parjimensis]